ncbi:hypothetical protein HY629_01560 [Candidatus Uhrbacteria bacterium]|nr:hypothetical protein [Candidatus Uhrbacteria bacterium]
MSRESFLQYRWVITVVLGTTFIVGVPFVFAQTFTPPSDFPPKGNVEPPINASATAQTKKGQLTVPTLCLGLTNPDCQSVWPKGGLTSMPTLQQVTDAGKSTTQTVQLKGGIQGTQTDKWSLAGNTASTDSPFIEFWGLSNANTTRRGELTLGANSATGRIKFYNYSGTWKPPLMTITPSGNVGIGTEDVDPQKKLDVVGDMRLTGTLTEGTVPWVRLSTFPTACKTGEYVESVGGTLTCKTLPAAVALPTGTHDQTIRNNNGTWVSNGNFLVDQTGKLTQGSIPWGRLTERPSCPGNGIISSFSQDGKNVECTMDIVGGGTKGKIPIFSDERSLAQLIEDSGVTDDGTYLMIGGAGDFSGWTAAPARNLTVNGNFLLAGTMQSGTVPWSRLSDIPVKCPSGEYVSEIGIKDSFKCSKPSGSGGASLPAGTTGQTLRYKGNGWVADSTLFNDPITQSVGIGTTSLVDTNNNLKAKLVIDAGPNVVALDVGGGGTIATPAPKKIINVAMPTGTSDAATKGYVDLTLNAQTTSSNNYITYTVYGSGTNPARGANAPQCSATGGTEIFLGWGPLTGEAAWAEGINGAVAASSDLGELNGTLDAFNEISSTNCTECALIRVLKGIGNLVGLAGKAAASASTSVPPTVGGIPIMQSCSDLPLNADGTPQGLAIFLGNTKDNLPGNSPANDRANYTIGAMVPSGIHYGNQLYNSCRICFKKIP